MHNVLGHYRAFTVGSQVLSDPSQQGGSASFGNQAMREMQLAAFPVHSQQKHGRHRASRTSPSRKQRSCFLHFLQHLTGSRPLSGPEALVPYPMLHAVLRAVHGEPGLQRPVPGLLQPVSSMKPWLPGCTKLSGIRP